MYIIKVFSCDYRNSQCQIMGLGLRIERFVRNVTFELGPEEGDVSKEPDQAKPGLSQVSAFHEDEHGHF